ncbi:MAG: type IV secretion system DNA-binding domain-containing protein [Pseudomonadota bacterium]
MREDIRFSKESATLTHNSARGRVKRNATNFTRGSQLFHHEVLMTWAGIKIPLIIWAATAAVLLCGLSYFTLKNHDIQLVIMKWIATLWNWLELNPIKPVNLTLPSGQIVQGPMAMVPYHSAVEAAWARVIQVTVSSMLGAAFICVPLTVWFFDFSRRRGSDILTERHERGSILVEDSRILEDALVKHNWEQHRQECAAHEPALNPDKVLKLSVLERARKGLHTPYRLAGLPMPWRLEQSHAMFIGTTGSGKTTELKKIVRQARERGHRCVIFDLTGSFVESFYNADTDIILNPMDRRCEAWSIFNDCSNYAEFMSAAAALVPSGHNAEDDFWQKAARTLFVEMCMKMAKMGVRTNGGLAYFLMQSDLKTISRQLEGTLAGPLMSPSAAKMAESIRATFNANANVFRFLPEPPKGEDGFSINKWMTQDIKEGSILFITSSHPDLVLNRPLLTLWMDLAVNALFRVGRTRDLRTWFLIDEVHALHRLPAIEHGLQTARAVGGAFVLGMHSFGALKDTYGENGATHLTSLAGTKLILKLADHETAEQCMQIIGRREVRQMDEAYSYGYNNSRDASTITPRKQIEELVMAEDIKDLPSLHGFVKFPDGFPAAPIKLTWRDYVQVAQGFDQVTDMRAADYKPTKNEAAEMGVDGREGDGRDNKPRKRGEANIEQSEAEIEAEQMRKDVERSVDTSMEEAEREIAQKADGRVNPERTDSEDEQVSQYRFKKSGEKDYRERQKQGQRDNEERSSDRKQQPEARDPRTREDDQESELSKENLRGFGSEERDRGDFGIDDDDQEMER